MVTASVLCGAAVELGAALGVAPDVTSASIAGCAARPGPEAHVSGT